MSPFTGGRPLYFGIALAYLRRRPVFAASVAGYPALDAARRQIRKAAIENRRGEVPALIAYPPQGYSSDQSVTLRMHLFERNVQPILWYGSIRSSNGFALPPVA